MGKRKGAETADQNCKDINHALRPCRSPFSSAATIQGVWCMSVEIKH